MKLFAILLVFTVPSVVGLYKATALKKRVSQLQAIRDSIAGFRLEMLYARSSPGAFFKKQAQTCPLFAEMDGADTESAYIQAKSVSADKMFLKDDDWDAIDRFFCSVGKNNLSNQDKLCAYAAQVLEEKIINAKNECGKYFKLYSLSGVMTGLFFAVILM